MCEKAVGLEDPQITSFFDPACPPARRTEAFEERLGIRGREARRLEHLPAAAARGAARGAPPEQAGVMTKRRLSEHAPIAAA
jgi:hypothetical protein